MLVDVPVRNRNLALLLSAAMWLAPSFAGAAEISGSIDVSGGRQERDTESVDILDENYVISLVQPLSTTLKLSVGYRYRGMERETELGEESWRNNASPTLNLLYTYDKFRLQLVRTDRRTRSSIPTSDFDASSSAVLASWLPDRGPVVRFQYRNDKNFSDTAVFGRNVTNESLALDVGKDHRDWSAWYQGRIVDVENTVTGLTVDQQYHQVRGTYRRTSWEEKLELSASGRIRRSESDSRVPAGTTIDQPVPVRLGLFALDDTPELWSLDPAPQLSDGDTETPVSPEIDIGGANTYRNIGVDLGFSRPVSQLEITVADLSGPALTWDIYHSSDNLNWLPVPGATATWDETFLRYEIRFQETEARYFKAVNISVNPESRVLVTEIRALREVDGIGRRSSHATDLQADLAVLFRPNEKVDGSFNLSYYDEDDIIPGIVIQGLQDLSYRSDIRVLLSPDWNMNMYYRFSNRKDDNWRTGDLLERSYGANLNWQPLPALNGRITAAHREEEENGTTLRKSDSFRMMLATQFYPELLLISELSADDQDNPLDGFTQSRWTWRESLIAQMTRTWNLSGSFSYTDLDANGTLESTRRTALDLATTWTPFQKVYVSATLTEGRDGDSRTTRQQYVLSWSPGRKLSFGAQYVSSEVESIRTLSSSSLTMNYRPHRRLRLYATAYRSSDDSAVFQVADTTSLRVGLRFTI